MEDLRVRVSVRELEREYNAGNRQPLEDLLRAWRGIKALPPEDPNSFFVLGGFHGEPFEYRDTEDLYWGGYCNHGNVLFPTWHRVYVHKLENALRTIVPTVTMPFWDETSEQSLELGVPSILTDETVKLDGETIPNPLRSFVLPLAMSDNVNQPAQGNVPNLYAKPAGYETERYPRSGLVGTPAARAATEAHNQDYTDPLQNTVLLNDNVTAWLRGYNPTDKDPNPGGNGIYAMYLNCLRAPNYTVFSNSTSAAEWSRDDKHAPQKALEDPHNDIHMSIGGLDTLHVRGLGKKSGEESGQVSGSNGDMGENNTAALDPIFFFHHCNVDRMFWLWQKQTGHTDGIEIIADYPGANSNASQGPTPGYAPDTPLAVDSPLYPFNKDDGSTYVSTDCLNIESQMGYTYGPGSFDDGPGPAAVAPGRSMKKLTVSALDRSLFQGSFVLTAFARVPDADGTKTDYYLGHHSVLSRGNVINCANCLTHLEVVAHFSLDALPADAVDSAEFRVDVRHRGDDLPADMKLKLQVQD